MPDMAIADRLRCDPSITVDFASYGTGFRTLAAHGEAAHDLAMPDENPFVDSVVRTTRLARELSPDLILAHEEFAAMLGAETCGIPALFLTDWFLDPHHLWTQCLKYAREILFIDDPGKFTEPPFLFGRVFYTGALVRPLQYRKSDRNQARRELGLDPESVVVSCMPGTTHEQLSPILANLVAAFDLLPFRSKNLVWVDEINHAAARRYFGNRKDIISRKVDWALDRIMVASDVVLNKGTRNILRELQFLSIPSVSVSHGKNWPDDVLANRIPTNSPLRASEITPEFLSEALQKAIATRNALPPAPPMNGLEIAVNRIREHVAALPIVTTG
jgi:hypothetical protein